VEYLNPVLVGVFASLIVLYSAFKVYFYASSRVKYSAARLFLMRDKTISSLKALVVSVVIFITGRVVSILILLNVLGESVIYSVRVPIDVTATILLTYALLSLHEVVKPRRVEVKASRSSS